MTYEELRKKIDETQNAVIVAGSMQPIEAAALAAGVALETHKVDGVIKSAKIDDVDIRLSPALGRFEVRVESAEPPPPPSAPNTR